VALKTATLSPAALALFRLHVERHGDFDVDANRKAYRELERAGLMIVGNTFAGGQDSVYHVTKLGFERKAELLACARESAASKRRCYRRRGKGRSTVVYIERLSATDGASAGDQAGRTVRPGC
jgi:hypothetical protein